MAVGGIKYMHAQKKTNNNTCIEIDVHTAPVFLYIKEGNEHVQEYIL